MCVACSGRRLVSCAAVMRFLPAHDSRGFEIGFVKAREHPEACLAAEDFRGVAVERGCERLEHVDLDAAGARHDRPARHGAARAADHDGHQPVVRTRRGYECAHMKRRSPGFSVKVPSGKNTSE